MKVLQVAPLMSPNNDYGGPMTVALGQCRALQRAGQDVILAAGTWGYDHPPRDIDGVRVELFPARSLVPGSVFGGITAPRLFPWLLRAARRADVVHIHLARDLLTLPAALMCAHTEVPFFLQTHGMVVDSDSPMVAPLDLLLTRTVMNRAERVFYLTEAEREALSRLFPTAQLEFLRNGIESPAHIARAESLPLEVLYLARIQERKRPLDFVAMARALAPEFPDVRFRLIGPDEGQGSVVNAAIDISGLGDRLVWEGAIPPGQTPAALDRASLYVLPSVNEPYPMSVLEALSHGLPVVITETCGLAGCVQEWKAGRVVSSGSASVTEAVRYFLADPHARATAAQQALNLAASVLSMTAVTEKLTTSYHQALSMDKRGETCRVL